ncbi:MAG: hypothetical protein SCABRO_03456, partial [Candidatus Scalindua brodae]
GGVLTRRPEELWFTLKLFILDSVPDPEVFKA